MLSVEEKASTGGAASGTATDGKPGPNVMDPGTRGGRNNAVYIAAVAALGVAFWWRYSSGAIPTAAGWRVRAAASDQAHVNSERVCRGAPSY